MRLRHSGFSLVELMIAILLAAVTGVVVLNVLSNYQTRSSTTTGRNDAQISAALGMYSLEREIRMAGAGLMTPNSQLCTMGVNLAYNGAAVFDGAALVPLRIIDGGGAAPDTVEVIRSDSETGAAPTRLLQAMAATTSTLAVNGSLGLTPGDLMMVGAPDGSKICTVMQLSQTPTVDGSGWTLNHDSGAALYNPADPSAVFTTAMQYDVRDSVVNMGRYGIRRYGVICNDGATPGATNSCDLGWWDRLAVPAPTIATISSIAPQIVDLQAQYGVAPAGSQVVDTWVDATGIWANPGPILQRRIKAVRFALVARGNRDPAGPAFSPASLVLWDDPGTANDRNRALSAAEQRYRYQVLQVVVPLINIIWAGV